jgi:hypothetical protein
MFGASLLIALLLVIFFAVLIVAFLWWLVVLREAVGIVPAIWSDAGQNKTLYVAAMFLLPLVGSALYLLVARPQLRAAGANI